MVLFDMIKIKSFFVSIFVALIVAGCSSTSDTSVEANSSPDENPLAQLTFADNSSDAFNRACYWLKEGNNIFGYERIKEGNELSRSEGKLPVLGVEQAMEIVFRNGEPQAIEEYQMVKDFCLALGFSIG